MAEFSFSSQGIDPAKPFEPLPPGDYMVAIINSGFEPTKDGRGSFLKLEMQVLEGASKGRTLFDRLNLNNPSEKAVEIARRTMAAIVLACGKISIQNTEEIHNIPMTVKVAVSPIDGKPGQFSNEVKGYIVPEGAGGGAPSGAVAPAATSQTSGGLPWQR